MPVVEHAPVALIGSSPVTQAIRTEIQRISHSDAKVLITGESGVGKEIVARLTHDASRRAAGPFVPLNCAGLPETLLESELFGHVKGSFTGAYRDKPGKLELAQQGTVFLDEVGEMTLRMQGLLLRFLETGEIQKVGADRTLSTLNVRTIAATNRDLRQMVEQGQFREDLYYRLNVIHLHVPPLRERREDIPELVEHFTARHRERGTTARGFAPDAVAALTQCPWPGNVRELENVVERLLVTAATEYITAADLPLELVAQPSVGLRPKKDRRRSVADDLYARLQQGHESFWTAVYPLYMQREITRNNVRDLVRRGLEEARGNYKVVVRLFNIEQTDYKRFLNFLRKHDCQLPFKEYR